MTEQSWAWRIVDSETNEVQRFYLDGAALAAIGKPHDKAFWDRHPLVERIENRWIGPDDEVEVKVWLTGQVAPDAPVTPKPDHPADLEFIGEWKSEGDFWAAHPDAEHVEFIQHIGEEPADDSWAVSIWLRA